uniref:Uncharacterized protein n=1 Tax=Knipowitschia caucasica TaxID=637954 RepID=A0AAV2MA19_KNICA
MESVHALPSFPTSPRGTNVVKGQGNSDFSAPNGKDRQHKPNISPSSFNVGKPAVPPSESRKYSKWAKVRRPGERHKVKGKSGESGEARVTGCR